MNTQEKVAEILARRPSQEEVVEAARVKRLLNIQIANTKEQVEALVGEVFALFYGVCTEKVDLLAKAQMLKEAKAQVDLVKAQLDLMMAGIEKHTEE